MKRSYFCILFFGVLICFSCHLGGNDRPVEQPQDILHSFMSFWYYWNENVKLSLDCIAYDENDSLISENTFLEKLSSGEYLPLRLQPDSLYVYRLYKLASLENRQISDTMENIPNIIADYGKRYYRYFQMKGKPLPRFFFIDLKGDRYNPETCKGKILVLNVWFRNCHACREEMPALNRLVKSYERHHEVLFISLGLDSREKIEDFLAKNEFDYAVVPDMGHYITDSLKCIAFPTHFIVNKRGIIVNVTDDYQQMEIMLRKEVLNTYH